MADPARVLDRDTKGYEEDFCLWAEAQAALLRSGRFDALDIENLAEEIDLMSGRDRQAIESDLVVLLKHLLKYRYQAPRRTAGWKSSIIEHRRRVIRVMEDSPSLRRHLLEQCAQCYGSAREQAAIETGLPLSRLPEDPDFDLDRALDGGFWPEPPDSEPRHRERAP